MVFLPIVEHIDALPLPVRLLAELAPVEFAAFSSIRASLVIILVMTS